ncbi:hypothetical protein KUCAC02_001708 [Chaenocephalus aceratus]|uniref:Uncharacterized protein n=1 Tax=Chaenocephalus aceratus TaxID=36190 RepID=A0ACB9XTQ2_CHAAC|nr:hypothetical protein KUCAC02_001708 [Chaenocephalus aceratus]
MGEPAHHLKYPGWQLTIIRCYILHWCFLLPTTKDMQLEIFQYETFRRHARNDLEPAIIHKWKTDQLHFFPATTTPGGKGHSWRRYESRLSRALSHYALMQLGSNTIVDFQLVQSNEVGGSYHMEKEGLKRCLDHLESNDLAVEYIVTDRHPQIQKFLRERNMEQSYDVWHFEKGLSKKRSQNKDCKVLKRWLHSIKKHVYWSATGTTSGPEKVASWTSVVNHLQNIHDPLFLKCSHPERASSDANKWLKPGKFNIYETIGNNK